ncbi:hemolysin family protein [Deinococcus pimensis]|uniref:hemolysin family protein n=1 Tax=Deinococcus pimensis TaxID=309888 RepID=UPI0004832B1D|nr:hemolysin family protein [Deinococcus pimensis]
MGNPFVELGILILLLILNGVFSGSELALMSARKARLDVAAENGSKAAATASRLAERPGAFLATVQIGITLIATISAVFAGGSLTRRLEPLLTPVFGGYAPAAASVAVVLLVTYLSLIIGELVPKNLALRNPEGLSTRVAPLMSVLSTAAQPVVWLLDTSTRLVLLLFGIRGEPQEHVTEEDVRALVGQAAESGSLETEESQRIERVLRFTDRRVRAVMTPRPDVHVIDLALGLSEIVQHALTSGHDHYPVKRDGEDIVGVLSVLDLLRALHDGQHPRDFVQPALFVPESAWAEDVLTTLQRHQRSRLAIVIDEYGDFTGLITVGDLLSELAGEADAPGETTDITRREDGTYLVDARVGMHDLRDELPLPLLEEEDFSTLAGYVLSLAGAIPSVGEVLHSGDWRIEVLDLDGMRVDRVLVTPPDGFVDASVDDGSARYPSVERG